MVLFAGVTEGELVVKYKEYPVNDQNQVLRCIRCDNEDLQLEDRYCKICGATVYNYCAGQYIDVGDGTSVLVTNQSCGLAKLPSNARFCTACGCVSAFQHAGLLSLWEVELQDSQNTEIVPETAQHLDFLDDAAS